MRLSAILLLLCAVAVGQTSGTIPSSGGGAGCVSVGVGSRVSTVMVQVSGTWTGTLQPEITVQGQAAANVQVTPSTSAIAQSTITANGIYTALVNGADTFLVCGNTVASGTASVYLNLSVAAVASNGGSGGGGTASVAAASYGVKGDGRFVWDATITNTSKTVTCPSNDCNFTAADVGKIVFGTNASSGGYTGQITSVLILPQGTITTVNSAQSITVSQAATASSTAGAGLLIWGDDDTTALTNAWNATVASCSTLTLPGVNPSRTGPAVMLIQSPSFNTAMAASGVGDNPTCSLGTGGSRRGLGLTGAGVNSTYIIPTPSFNFSNCTFGASAHACMFTTFDGVNLNNFTFWGAGISNPGSVSSDYVTEINSAAIAFSPTAGNSQLNNVTFMGWGTNASGTGFKACIRFDGGVTSTAFLTEDGCGQVGLEANNLLILNNVTAFDNMGANLVVQSNANVSSGQSYYCCTGQGGGGDTNVAVFGTFYSDGDVYGATTFAGGALNASNGITVGYYNPGAGAVTGSGGIAHINNAVVNVAGNAGSGQGIFVCGTQGATCPGANTLYLSNSSVNIGNSRPPLTLYGNYIDLGGNTFNGTPSIAASGKVFGSASVTGATLSSVATTSGWGTSPSVGSISGNSVAGQFTVTVGTTPSANPVATVTFPTTFLATPTCNATQIGGTQATGFVTVGTVSTSSLPLTWIGTPSGGNTIQICYHCWN